MELPWLLYILVTGIRIDELTADKISLMVNVSQVQFLFCFSS